MANSLDTWTERLCLLSGCGQVGAGKGAPGTVLAASPDGVEVACAEGSLTLLSLQPEGKRAMTAREFLASRKLVLGSTPFS